MAGQLGFQFQGAICRRVLPGVQGRGALEFGFIQ
jgi:hypothetical protein